MPASAFGVAVIGQLPAGLPPAPELPSWTDVRQLLLPAVGLVVVGYSDNVLTEPTLEIGWRRVDDAHWRYTLDEPAETVVVVPANDYPGRAGRLVKKCRRFLEAA